MIDPNRLFQLEGGRRRRKVALTLDALERAAADGAQAWPFRSMSRADYAKALVRVVLSDPALPRERAERLMSLSRALPFDERRAVNFARDCVLSMMGETSAEWDLVIAPHDKGALAPRDFFPGVAVYAEDIRSPFNLGSIFRTAEAMGVERVILSPFCVDPGQKRAARSAMGSIDSVRWERMAIEELPSETPVFALETGGTPIDEFNFPASGVCVLGSEELGVSPDALRRANLGIVSIPMKGRKASLNVGVAFGVLMKKWAESIERRRGSR